MLIAITIVHVLVSVGLILVVLLQTGKGAEVGAVFGGSSSTIFGSSGAGNFLTRLTTGMAIVFMMTSLALGYFAGRKPSATIFDNRAPAASPVVPLQPQAPQEQQTSPSSAQPTAPTPEKSPPEKPATP
jgi:preprotein translocase subunit SecG